MDRAPHVVASEPAGPQAGPVRDAALQAYAALVFTTTCWSGNAVAGQLAVGEASPMVVTCLRWAVVALFLFGLSGRDLKHHWPELRRNAGKIVLMGMSGYTMFNALFYVSAHFTTAVNISILQGAIPVFVLLGAAVVYRTRVRFLQVVGTAATLVGIAVVASRGHMETLSAFRLNAGDGLMIIATMLYAGYTLALRDRPAVPSLVFFSAMAGVAFVTSLPLVAVEAAMGSAQWPTLQGWALVAFIAVFPSFLSQLAFMRGVRLIGPSRAGLFANLVPITGAILAVAILGEAFAMYHLVALVLVIGGILVAELSSRRLASVAAR